MFEDLSARPDVAADEKAVLDFWDANDIFRKSLAWRAGSGKTWVFYEGPPTANGKPHAGHVLTRVIKDLYPRYKTMCGFHVPRKAGWDTHGLPVEIEVEKELGISGKPAIEAYGVEPFIRKCQESVFVYTKEWEELTRRIGFWIDLSDPYITYTTDYVESVWWALKTIHEKGLLYRGHKVLPWCPSCQTALSSHEVGLGYQDIRDPSIYVTFCSDEEPGVSYLAWTTTPWTLISNVALAVDAATDYAYVRVGEETLVLAQALVETVMAKLPKGVEYETVKTVKGRELVGKTYEPLYNFDPPDKPAWRIIAADFVTLDTGSGIVHMAPAYGEDDYRACRAEGLPTIHLVKPDGTFRDEVTPWAGVFVKEADKGIIKDLKARKLLLRRESHEHSYPHCWRCTGPLLYFAREAWFIKTTDKIQRLLANNDAITWRPEHIQTGRFGNFLENNVDWALSRERFWGTPLPIWVCDACGHEEAFSSLKELEDRNPDALAYWKERKAQDDSLNEHLVIHKPFVDHVEVPCAKCGGTMKRVPEVIDCWFDSGAMPFAQWGYPHRGKEQFAKAFPADWISEAIDQTRGWFYSLLAVSTLVFEDQDLPHPYGACLVLGHVCDENGVKYSKHLKNYVPPEEILDREGADALRWFFCGTTAPWNNSRFSEKAVREGRREFLIKLREIAKFFVTYAKIDGFHPAGGNPDATGTTPDDLKSGTGYRPAPERAQLDRWVLAELQTTIRTMRERLDDYDIYGAARALQSFVDGLSNWYLRRSRRRFWAKGLQADKLDAYWTLYECLVTVLKLAAPFTPFQTESLYQNLVRGPWPDSQPESVHLNEYPVADASRDNAPLTDLMELARAFVELGHAARAKAKIRVRQPLGKAILVPTFSVYEKIKESGPNNYSDSLDSFLDTYGPVIREELNVKAIVVETKGGEDLVSSEIKPNFQTLGPKYGSEVKKIAAIMGALNSIGVRAAKQVDGTYRILDIEVGKEYILNPEDVDERWTAKEGFHAANGPLGVLVLHTELTPELIAEGLARDVNNRVQGLRRELDLPYQQRVKLAFAGSQALLDAVRAHEDWLKAETLAVEILPEAPGWPDAEAREFTIEGESLTVWLVRV